MLCSACSNIDFTPPYQHNKKHHASFEDVIDAAENGCELCKLIIEEEKHCNYPHRGNRGCDDESLQIFYRLDSRVGDQDFDPFRDSSPNLATIYFEQETKEAFARQEGTVLHLGFDLFTEDVSSPAKSGLINGRPVEGQPDSDACFTLVEAWMNDCLLNHKESCSTPSEAQLPTRVIDVGRPDGSDLPKVIASEGTYGTWISLSHCWGSSTPFILDSTNSLERMCGISTADLPATFYDAIRVTRKLGFRFLWIDSLCILQDSEEDWVSESCLMQRYYEQASLTIASDSSFGDDQSFLHVKRSKDQNAVTIPVKLHNAFMPRLLKESSQVGEVVHIRSEVRGFHDLAFLQGHALSRRGWTLQEEFFSPRSLHYAPDQLLWECRKGKKTEGLRSMLLTGTYYRGLNLKNVCLSRTENMVMNCRWYILVESYVPRRLTFPSDRFPALSALARFVAKQTDFTYRAGIWLEDYCIGLLWFCADPEARSDPYVAPSWSWASINKRTTSPGIFHPQRTASDFAKQIIQDMQALLVSCHVVLKGADDFGTLLSGLVTLRGIHVTSGAFKSLSIGHIIFLHGNYRAPERGIPDENTVLCYFDEPLPRQALDPDYIIPSRSPISEGVLRGMYFFYVTTASYPEGSWWPEDEGNISYFLLLAPIENKGQFLRTGVAMMSVNTLLAMKAFWEVVEVTII